MNDQERELDLMVAELEQENRLLRARNERLEAEQHLQALHDENVRLGLYEPDHIPNAKKMVAQPEQEPDDLTIAYMSGLSRGKDLAPQRTAAVGEDSKAWVGLTDEEAQWLYDNCRSPSNLIDMAEAKLKDLNT